MSLIDHRALMKNVRPQNLENVLQAGFGDVPGLEELVLSVALGEAGSDAKDSRALAKTVIAKHGSPPVQQALKLKARKKYEGAGAKSLAGDLEELAAVAGFRVHLFAKGLARSPDARAGYRYFLAKASHEELVWHFKNDHWDGDAVAIETKRCPLAPHALEALIEALGDASFAAHVQELHLHVAEDFTLRPDALETLSSLWNLDLTAPKLSTFPEAFCTLASLQVLRVPDAVFPSISANIARLTKLRRLNLAGTAITQLPPEIGSLERLSELNVAGSRLESLPEELARCPLSVLDVRDTKIDRFPSSLLTLPRLDPSYRTIIDDLYGCVNPVDIALREMQPFLRQFAELPQVQTTLERHRRGDADAAEAYALVLAVGKCHVDDEHGQSHFLRKHVNEHTPPEVRAANEAIQVPLFYAPGGSRAAVEAARHTLRKHGCVDADRFATFVEVMLASREEVARSAASGRAG